MAYFTFLTDWSCQTIAVFLAVFLTMFVFFNRRKNLPPPPGWSWPVVGHLLSLGRAPHLKLTEWRKQYCDVYTVRMGMEDVVVLNGYRAIKEAFVDYKDAFSSRPDIYAIKRITGFGKDIAFAKFNKAYKEKRKFAFNALRNLGMKMGPDSIEEYIRGEARQLCVKVSSGQGDITDNLTVSVANIVCSMAFGKRYDYDDAKFLDLTKAVNNMLANLGDIGLMRVFPFLRFIPGANATYRSIVNSSEKVLTFVRQEITGHRETFESENPRDFIDLILSEQDSREKTKENTDCLTDETIVFIVQDLFFAGVETTTTTLRWGLLYMVLCPDEQLKVQAELDSVLGKDPAVPTLAHRPQLPYTEATIMEVQRIRAITPLGTPHAPVEDTTFRGYDIPAGTQVLANVWSAHMDPEYWPDPEKFDPRRFLDSEGRVVRRPDSFLPFSTGRRVCLGEQLAKMELFLIFSSLLKHFIFTLPEGTAAPSTDGRLGTTLVPPRVKMCITQR